jgi:hypothetical protein
MRIETLRCDRCEREDTPPDRNKWFAVDLPRFTSIPNQHTEFDRVDLCTDCIRSLMGWMDSHAPGGGPETARAISRALALEDRLRHIGTHAIVGKRHPDRGDDPLFETIRKLATTSITIEEVNDDRS